MVIQATIQLETWHNGKMTPVARYDDAHARTHRDIYDHRGNQVRKDWLDISAGEMLTLAEADFRDNWERYVSEFFGS